MATFNRRVTARLPPGPVFVLHDTTEFAYQKENTNAIAVTKSINSGCDKAGP